MAMPGCVTINQGRHIGLQQLAALAAATNAFLGPNKRCKFVEDEESGDSSLVCSSFRLLEQLDLSCAVGQLLNETVQAHHREFRTGTGCLLFMAGVWSTAALQCLHEGVPILHIVSAMLEGLDSCLESCEGIRLPVREVLRALERRGICGDSVPGSPPTPADPLFPSLSRDMREPGARGSGDEKVHATEMLKPRLAKRGKTKIKLTHSRHFGPNEQRASSSLGDPEPVDVPRLASAVSHGCKDMMSLVVEASRIQAESVTGKDGGHGTFDVGKLVTCLLSGPAEGSACALRGFVTRVFEEQALTAKRLEGRSLRVAIFSGDLSEDYRHLGFSRPRDVHYVASGKPDAPGLSLKAEWTSNTLATLLRLKVDVLLAGGSVAGSLIERCIGPGGPLLVERVKRGVLADFAETTGAVPVAYASQLSDDCVGGGAHAFVWRDCGTAGGVSVNILADGTRLVTAVVASCVHGKLRMLEDRFWGCAHRLHHVLRDGGVLPGAGVTEMLCARRLRELARGESDRVQRGGECPNLYRGAVLRRMADGWLEYVATVIWNSGACSSKLDAWTVVNQSLKGLGAGTALCACLSERLYGDEGGSTSVVYDNVAAKLEAWRRALDLVLLVLQTDAEIITGFNAKDAERQSDLMLL